MRNVLEVKFKAAENCTERSLLSYSPPLVLFRLVACGSLRVSVSGVQAEEGGISLCLSVCLCVFEDITYTGHLNVSL